MSIADHTIRFVPLPRLVLPTQRRPCWRGRNCRRGRFRPSAAALPRPGRPKARATQRASCRPPAVTAATAASRSKATETPPAKPPSGPSLQNPENALEAGPIRGRRSPASVASPLPPREQRLDQLPLLIGQQLLPSLIRNVSFLEGRLQPRGKLLQQVVSFSP